MLTGETWRRAGACFCLPACACAHVDMYCIVMQQQRHVLPMACCPLLTLLPPHAPRGPRSFYRLMGASGEGSSSSGGSSGGSGEDAALAFKAVAVSWYMEQEAAAALAGGLAAGEMGYLSLLWLATGDLTAPVVAALAARGVEHWHLLAAVAPKSQKRKGGHGRTGGRQQQQ